MTEKRVPEYVLLKVILTLRAPGAVAAPEQAENLGDGRTRPISRDPFGNPYVPATSIAGTLRDHLRRELGDAVEGLMGSEPGEPVDEPADRQDEPHLTPSALRVLGTEVTAGAPVVRTRTAIDRSRAAPATHTLNSAEYLPVGTTVTVYLRLDDATREASFVDALKRWRPSIGGGRSTGFGRAEVTALRRRVIDLGTPEGRRAWLTAGGPALFADEDTTAIGLLTAPPNGDGGCRWQWEIVDGLHVGGDPDAASTLNRATGMRSHTVARVVLDHEGRPYVPATTWKGVLRSRCEYILRSLGLPTCDSAVPGGHCGRCLVCGGFGHVTANGGGGGARGRLTFADSPITDAELVVRQHVGLDRVFGGAAQGILFAQQIVQNGRLTLDIDGTGRDDAGTDAESAALRALLVLAVRDIHVGRVGVGAETTRGHGTLRLTGDDVGRLEQARADAVRTLLVYHRDRSAAASDLEPVP